MVPARVHGSFLGDVPDDPATPAQRARLDFLTTQLHAIGLATQQAQDRGDTAAIQALQATAAPLKAEYQRLQSAIIAQGNQIQAQADAGAYDSPLQKFAQGLQSTLEGAGIAAAVGLGLLAYFLLRGR